MGRVTLLASFLALAAGLGAAPLELPWDCGIPSMISGRDPRWQKVPRGTLPSITVDRWVTGAPGIAHVLIAGEPVGLARVPLPEAGEPFTTARPWVRPNHLPRPSAEHVEGSAAVGTLEDEALGPDGALFLVRSGEGDDPIGPDADGHCGLLVSSKPDGEPPRELDVDLPLDLWKMVVGHYGRWGFELGPDGALYGTLHFLHGKEQLPPDALPKPELVEGPVEGVYAVSDAPPGSTDPANFHYVFRVTGPGWIRLRVPLPGGRVAEHRFPVHPEWPPVSRSPSPSGPGPKELGRLAFRARGAHRRWLRADRAATIMPEGATGGRAHKGEWTWFRVQVDLGRASDPDQFVLQVPGGEAYPEGLDADSAANSMPGHLGAGRARLDRRAAPWFFGRTRTPKASLTLVDRAHSQEAPRKLGIPTAPAELGALRKGFRRARLLHAGRLLQRFPDAPVLHAWAAALRHEAGGAGARRHAGTALEQAPPGRPEVDLYTAFTGALAIQETLQLEAGPEAGASDEAREVPVEELAPPELEELPFDQLRAGREPRLHPMDRVVPSDLLYVHFSDFAAMRRVVETLDEWGTDLLHFVSARGRDARVVPRYQARLGLRVTALGELLGDQVIGEVGLVAFDPFFREGTDVAVLLEPKVPLALATYRETVFADLSARGATARKVQIPGLDRVRALERDDGTARLYWAEHCGYEVFASGPRVLEALVRGGCEGAGAVAHDPGYRYMRALEPATPDEGAFAYLSDPFVRRMVGPAWKVATARRNRCAASLGALGHRARFDAAWAASLAAGARCPGGGRYILEGATARCSVHGTLRSLKPLSETPVRRVSARERDSYARWVQGYERFWRGFMDPIGVRVATRGDLEVKVHVLPLVRNTVYGGLRRVQGPGAPKAPPLKARLADALGSLTLPAAPLLAPMLEGPGETAGVLRDELGLVAGPATLYAHDAEMLFLLRGLGRFLGEGLLRRGGSTPWVAAVLSLNMPLSMELPVRDGARVQRLLEDQLGRASRWSPSGRGMFSFGYDGYAMDGVSVYAFDLGPLRFHTFFAVEGDRLLAATKPDLILRLVAAVREGTGLPAAIHGEAPLRLELYPGATRRAASMLRMGWAADMRRACFRNLGDLAGLAMARGGEALPPPEELEVALGYRPVCGSGGSYRYAPARREAVCSAHGAPGAASQSLALPEGGGLARLRELRALGVGLHLGEDSLESQIIWKR
jgi:hypothetical protein